MSDIQLLKDAAKAAEIELDWNIPPNSRNPWRMVGVKGTQDYGPACEWNPLTDDGDALRLSVKLGLEIDPWLGRKITIVDHGDIDDAINENHDGDPYAATRRAIVRAAAEIGKTK